MPVVLDTSGGNGFANIQVGDIYYASNLFQVDLSLNTNTFVEWNIPCGAQISNGCYELPQEGSAEDTGQCDMCYRMQTPISFQDGNGNIVTLPTNDTSRVYGYPNMLFGSKGGRNTTWGVNCGATGELAPDGRCGFGQNPVYDMRDPNAAIGLPERLDRINTLEFCFDVDKNCSGDIQNVENVFVDTYLHRIDKPALYPVGHTGTITTPGNWGDLNKINSDATEAFNLNFKLCLPEFATGGGGITNDPGAQATGGVRINTSPIVIDNKDWAIYFKWENFSDNSNSRSPATGLPANGKCTNSFFYISFIPWNVGTGVSPLACNVNGCYSMKAFLDWVGSQEFKNRVQGTNGFAPIAADRQGSGPQANWPLWVYNNVGSPPFPVDNPEQYVFAGIEIGNELWYSPNQQESCVCWSNVQFTSDKIVTGKSTNAIMDEECCSFDVNVIGNEASEICCEFNVDVIGNVTTGLGTCDQCPTILPRNPIFINLNQNPQSFSIDLFDVLTPPDTTSFDFNINSIDLVGLNGSTTFNGSSFTYEASEIVCLRQGKVCVNYTYSCNDNTLDCTACFQVTLAPDCGEDIDSQFEISFPQFPTFGVSDGPTTDPTQPPAEPICYPNMGRLIWIEDSNAWQYFYDEGATGIVKFIVPVFRNGCCKTCRHVTLCINPNENAVCIEQCKTMLFARNGCQGGYQLVGKINSWSIEESIEEVEEKRKRNKDIVTHASYRSWSCQIDGDIQYNISPQRKFQLGCDADIRIVACLENNELMNLYEGTVLVTSFTSNASGGGGARGQENLIPFSLSLKGQGNLIKFGL